MRGEGGNTVEFITWETRFTPTCVGKARAWPEISPGRAVHPHVRGEGDGGKERMERCCGSPPRAWGRRDGRDPVNYCERFTPTCVGKASSSWRFPSGRVHPHVRGEGDAVGYATNRIWRFTPTCVGKARRQSAAHAPVAVHPHVRGEGDGGVERVKSEFGSLPRAWGRLPAHLPHDERLRFTPTCVGKASIAP